MKAQADIKDLQNQISQRDQLNAKLKRELDNAKQESMRSMMQVGELKAEMKASEILRKSTSAVEKNVVVDKELSLSQTEGIHNSTRDLDANDLETYI